jgi:hypothetical protein
MSDFSSGAQRDLFYTLEDSFGTGPSILNMTEIRNTEDSISLARDNFVSDERRGDRGVHDLRMGNKQPAGDLGFEFSYGSFDTFLANALCSDLSANGITTTDMTATYIDAATGVMTSTGETFVTKGFAVGDKVAVTGWEAPATANNGTFTINAVTEETMTLSPITNLVTVVLLSAQATVDLVATSAWELPYEDVSISVTADAATDTFTRAGSWLTAGFRVGDVITTTTFDVEAGNNMTTQITALTDTVMTVSGSLTTEAGGDVGVFNTTAREIKKGTTVRSIALEKAFTDIGEYQKYTGGIANTLSLDIKPNGMVTGSFGFMFKDAANTTSAYHAGSAVAVGDNRPFDGFTGYVKEGGTANAQMSGMTLNLDNGFERNFVLMATTCPQMTSGKSNVTGTITLFFADNNTYTKFENETESTLEIAFQDDDLNGYVITLPRIKYTSAETPVNSDGATIVTMNFQALDDATELSNIVIRRQPEE